MGGPCLVRWCNIDSAQQCPSLGILADHVTLYEAVYHYYSIIENMFMVKMKTTIYVR